MSALQFRWLAPTIHAILFVVMWLIASNQSQPFLDGPARWPFGALFFADIPISVIGFSMMWDGKWNSGLLLWGVIGTAWWYLLAAGIRRLKRKQTTTVTKS